MMLPDAIVEDVVPGIRLHSHYLGVVDGIDASSTDRCPVGLQVVNVDTCGLTVM